MVVLVVCDGYSDLGHHVHLLYPRFMFSVCSSSRSLSVLLVSIESVEYAVVTLMAMRMLTVVMCGVSVRVSVSVCMYLCVRVVLYAGGYERAVVSTLAGGVGGTNQAFSDGFGTNAGFYNSFGVTVDASGNLFVADTSNNRIRKVTAGGGT